MWECQKGKLSTNLNYFLQNNISTISFQNERKTKMTLSISNGKTAFDTSNINNSNKIQWQKYNQLSRGGRLYDTLILTQNDSYDTVCVKKRQFD